MPLVFQHRIYRKDLLLNPTNLYLFGDNLERRGFGGQAAEMRGEPNAVGVATKKAPGMKDADFFSDEHFKEYSEAILRDLQPAKMQLSFYGIVVIPSDGLGTGLSELPKRAPRLHKFLYEQIEHMRFM